MTTLLWLEDDLRLRDHVALQMAARERGPIVPVVVVDDERPWARGDASGWWLHRSLAALRDRFAEHGVDLVLRRGRPEEALAQVAEAAGASRSRWTRRYEPSRRERAARARSTLESMGVDVAVHDQRILHDPDAIETTSGGPYHVFTPFYKRLKTEVEVGRPLSVPPGIEGLDDPVETLSLDALGLRVEDGPAAEFETVWTPGEAGARARLGTLVEETLARYPEDRDRPDLEGTSRLSPHLAFGEVSVREVWVRVRQAEEADQAPSEACQAFLRQLAWREFAYHLLYHYPETTDRPLREKYAGMRWREDPEHLERWRQGRTGYPLVDAGMRQLLETGWMHNRVRMVVASFLTKDLLLPWQEGARWFWDRLVDADLANNTLGWQWAAGCGADAQPFFRIFNPVKQGEQYDPDGAYVRRWVPELADLPDEHVHAPWRAPDEVLSTAGVVLGEGYPEPIVDHAEARERALAAYGEVR